jgi:hypothetical protein
VDLTKGILGSNFEKRGQIPKKNKKGLGEKN